MALKDDLKDALDWSGQTRSALQGTLSEGFDTASPAVDSNTLPSHKTPAQREGIYKRNIIHWFVPEFGVVKMYVNPKSIGYKFVKNVQSTQTKSGFCVQYWGERLPELSISGTTASSGIEGINVLYEIYRSEQLSFDTSALTIAADNDPSAGLTFESILSEASGLNQLSNFSQNVPSLASLAVGIEMYYQGWVFRGYFTSFNFDESSESPGIFNYNMSFTVTQRRGYRFNFMPWHKSAVHGPSHNVDPQSNLYKTNPGVPLTYKKLKE